MPVIKSNDTIELGNHNCISDAGVAAEMAYSCAYGAYYNVKINLIELKEEKKYYNNVKNESEKIISNLDKQINQIRNKVLKVLNNG